MVLFDKYRSFHLFVALPKSYVMFVIGIKFEVTKVPTDKTPVVIKLPPVMLPATLITLPYVTSFEVVL